MSQGAKDQAELGWLISRASDGSITPEEMGRLENVLLDNPKTQAFYHQYLALDVQLRWAFAEAPLLPAVPGGPEPISLPAPIDRQRARWFAPVVFAAASIAAVVLLALGLWHWGTGPVPEPGPGGSPAFARLVQLAGGVEVVGAGGEVAEAVAGQELSPGQTVRTAAEDSRAVLEYRDTTRLELQGEAVARLAPSGQATAGQEKKVFLARGFARIDVPMASEGQPMVLATPHAEAFLSEGQFISFVGPSSTRVEMGSGRAQVVRRADGKSLAVRRGSYVEAATDLMPMLARSLGSRLTQPRLEIETAAQALTFSPGGGELAIVESRQVGFWAPDTGNLVGAPLRRGQKLKAVVYLAGGKVLIGGAKDGEFLRAWAMPSRRLLWAVSRPRSTVRALAVSPREDILAVVDQADRARALVRTYDLTDGKERDVLRATAKGVLSLAFSPDGGQLIGGTIDGKLVVWDLAGGQPPRVLHGHKRQVEALAFKPGGMVLASGAGDGVVRLWGASDFELIQAFPRYGRPVRALAWAPNGRSLAAGMGDARIKVWGVPGGVERLLIEHAADLRGSFSLAFSPDGRTLVSGSSRKPVKLWDVSSLRQP